MENEQLSFKNANILTESINEFKDISKVISIELSNTHKENIKVKLLEMLINSEKTIINLEKQRRGIFPKQLI